MNEHSPHSERERQFEYAMGAVQRQLPSYTNWIRNHVRDLEEQVEALEARARGDLATIDSQQGEITQLQEQLEAHRKALVALIGWSDGDNGDDFGTTEWANARILVTNPAKGRE